MAEKTLNQQQVSSSDQGSKPETPRPSGMGPTARQLHKSKEIHREKVTRKPLLTSRNKEWIVATNENPTTKETKPSGLRSVPGWSGCTEMIGYASIIIRPKT